MAKRLFRRASLGVVALAVLLVGVPREASAQVFTAVDLNPSGFTFSYAYGVGAGQQVGSGSSPATGGNHHALLWSGDPDSFVDLHPSGLFDRSYAYGVDSLQQVGSGSGPATGNQVHALLWSGTAASFVDLHPSGFTVSAGYGVDGGQQVGFGRGPATGGNNHALLWSDTADSVVDLHAFLPPGFTDSVAWGIDFDGNIVGWATGPATGYYPDAFLWQPVVASRSDKLARGINSDNVAPSAFRVRGGPRSYSVVVLSPLHTHYPVGPDASPD